MKIKSIGFIFFFVRCTESFFKIKTKQKSVLLKKEIVLHITAYDGLDAVPSARFVQTACKYKSKVAIIKGNQKANGKSILEVLELAAENGSKITLVVEGEDAVQSIGELSEMLLNYKGSAKK